MVRECNRRRCTAGRAVCRREADASLVTAFEPDGSEAMGLAAPQFPGLNRPVAMTFRPH